MARVSVSPAGYRYRCDECGEWTRPAYLSHGRLLCLDCLATYRPRAVEERVRYAVVVGMGLAQRARELRQERKR